MNTQELTKENLAAFKGTTKWYRHPVVKKMLYTDGIKYVVERAAAYWLLDEITYQQYYPRVKNEEFQVWILSVDPDKCSAVLSCDDGNGRILCTKRIDYTDFPLAEIKIYVANNVILLPGEY